MEVNISAFNHTFSIVSTVLYGQKHKDPLSLIMHDVDQETYKTEEIKEDECTMENTELIRNSLEELHHLLERSEDFVKKVLVRIVSRKQTIGRKSSEKVGNRSCTAQ